MDNFINVDNHIDQEAADSVVNSITTIFESGFSNRISQKNIGLALKSLGVAFQQGHISINNSMFTNNAAAQDAKEALDTSVEDETFAGDNAEE